jgi:hypothetical protein
MPHNEYWAYPTEAADKFIAFGAWFMRNGCVFEKISGSFQDSLSQRAVACNLNTFRAKHFSFFLKTIIYKPFPRFYPGWP